MAEYNSSTYEVLINQSAQMNYRKTIAFQREAKRLPGALMRARCTLT